MSGRQAIRALEELGFEQVRRRGSHVVLKKRTSEGAVGCVVPLHGKLATGTLRGILKQARVAPEEFMDRLQGLTKTALTLHYRTSPRLGGSFLLMVV